MHTHNLKSTPEVFQLKAYSLTGACTFSSIDLKNGKLIPALKHVYIIYIYIYICVHILDMEHHSDFIQTNHGSGWSGPSLDWSRLFETHSAACRIATVNPEHHAETLSTSLCPSVAWQRWKCAAVTQFANGEVSTI